MRQAFLFDLVPSQGAKAPKEQLLKWIGNKQRFAEEIVSYFPNNFRAYFEPFLGSGAVLATLAPRRGVGSDSFLPLIEIWATLKSDPDALKRWYAERYEKMRKRGKARAYEEIRTRYNENPNGGDLLYLCRACYGGVVRFRQADGYMSTPCGIHDPIPPESFSRRVDEWHERIVGTAFRAADYDEAMDQAVSGDLIYCDPPYQHSQTILYGAQSFDLAHLFEVILRCKLRGVAVALSIDGTKKTGSYFCDVGIPSGLFEREVLLNCGRSMLKRFQMNGQSLEREVVQDRLLLTY